MVCGSAANVDTPDDKVMTASTETDNSVRQTENFPPLMDAFQRVHESLRISVTDACNIRCRYCMPEKVLGFLPQHRLLTYESITRIVSILARAGVRKVRLTGGEPLMRSNLEKLVEQLARVPGLQQIAMTTNGMLLADKVASLEAAGLTHVNISLDTLRESAFRAMSRREGLDQVLAGIDAAMLKANIIDAQVGVIPISLTHQDIEPTINMKVTNGFYCFLNTIVIPTPKCDDEATGRR